MAQSSHCCQSWDRNSVCCLMYDIDFQLMEAVEVSWDAMVASHYHTFCWLKVFEYTCDHTVVQTVPWFCFFFLS
jgi:hypothetical protein